VLYFGTTCTNQKIIETMQGGRLGMIVTPAQYNPIPDGVVWCGDNGRFGKGWPGDDGFVRFLERFADRAGDCKFVVAPDVPFDHKATLELSVPWLARIRVHGYPAALAVQDGAQAADLPWGAFDVLFIGGTDEFKVSPAVVAMVAEARLRGMWVHMGRVNTYRGVKWSTQLGCHSGDGQFFRYAPDKNLVRMLRYLRRAEGLAGIQAWEFAAAEQHPGRYAAWRG
jgi:hypothetical protein